MRNVKIVSVFLSSMICVGVAIVISILPTIKDGLELLFLLPISYALAIFLFCDIFTHWNENVGTALIVLSSVLRYVISPLLMSLSNHSVAYINAQTSSYRNAIFLMIYELFMVLIVMKVVRWKFLKARNDYNLNDNNDGDSFKVTWVGVVFCAFIILMLIMRGNLQNVFSHFSFLTTYSEDRSAVYTYDRTFVYLLKSFAFIVIASKMGKIAKQNRSMRGLCLAIAIVAALVNTVFYDHTSRSILVEFIVSSLFVLIYCFPKKKKFLIVTFTVAGIALVSSVFLFGTLQSTWSTLRGNANIFDRISEMGELYGNGVSTIAHAIDTYPSAHSNLGIGNFFGGFFKTLGFITFPGFRHIYYAFLNIPSASSIFMSSLFGKGFILPPIGLALYYGDIFLFVPISIIICYICIWTLYKIDSNKYKFNTNSGTIYVVTYAEIICGMSLFVNNVSIMIQGLTEIPLLMFIMLGINKLANIFVIRTGKYR